MIRQRRTRFHLHAPRSSGMIPFHRSYVVAIISAMLVSVSQAGDDKDTAIEKELKALEGNWQCTREEGGGKLTPEIIVKGFRLIIEGKKYQTVYGGKELGSAATIVTIDPTANPKTIDVEWTNGSWKDQTQVG